MNTRLADGDVAALLRIAGEVAELRHDVHARRAHILNGLLALVGGCGAVCSEVDPEYADTYGWALPDSITVAGAIECHEQLARSYLTGRMAALDPCTSQLLSNSKSVVTFRRADVMDDSWFRSDHFVDVRRPAGIGESIYSAFNTPDGRRLKVTFLRELPDSLYSERDVALVHLFNENLASLYTLPAAATVDAREEAPVPARAADGRIESLPPRLRPVLRRLLAGDAEKQVAYKLGLSRHTVHAYTRLLYKTFAVNSRGELLAQFVTHA